MRRVAIAAVLLLTGAAETALGHELFGMHLQNTRAFEQEFVPMERLGVTWVRRHIPWANLEPREGQFDFNLWDQLVASADRHHLKLTVTIEALSPWGSTELPPNYGERGGYKATTPSTCTTIRCPNRI